MIIENKLFFGSGNQPVLPVKQQLMLMIKCVGKTSCQPDSCAT